MHLYLYVRITLLSSRNIEDGCSILTSNYDLMKKVEKQKHEHADVLRVLF